MKRPFWYQLACAFSLAAIGAITGEIIGRKLGCSMSVVPLAIGAIIGGVSALALFQDPP